VAGVVDKADLARRVLLNVIAWRGPVAEFFPADPPTVPIANTEATGHELLSHDLIHHLSAFTSYQVIDVLRSQHPTLCCNFLFARVFGYSFCNNIPPFPPALTDVHLVTFTNAHCSIFKRSSRAIPHHSTAISAQNETTHCSWCIWKGPSDTHGLVNTIITRRQRPGKASALRSCAYNAVYYKPTCAESSLLDLNKSRETERSRLLRCD